MASDIIMFQDVKDELGQVVEAALRSALQSGSADVSRSIVKEELGEVVEEAMQAALESGSEKGVSISGRICQDVKSQLQIALLEMLPRAMRAGTAEISASISERVCSDVRQEIQTFSRSAAKTDSVARPSAEDVVALPRPVGEISAQPKRSTPDGAGYVSGSFSPDNPKHQRPSVQQPRMNSMDMATQGLAALPVRVTAEMPPALMPALKPRTSERRSRGSSIHSDTSYPLDDDDDDYEMQECIDCMEYRPAGFLLSKVRSEKPDRDDENTRSSRSWPSTKRSTTGRPSFLGGVGSTTVKSVAFRQSERSEMSAVSHVSVPSGSSDVQASGDQENKENNPALRVLTSFHGLLPQGTKSKSQKWRRLQRRASTVGGAFMSSWKKRILALVSSRQFEVAVAMMLIFNALFIGVQVDWMARNTDHQKLPVAFKLIGWMFCLLFVVEIALRIFVYGLRFFCVPEWKWNVFDLIVVSLQLAEELTDLLVDSLFGINSSNEYTNFTAVRVLRVLRLVRVMRFMRILRLIRELHTMVGSIIGSLRSFLWTMSLLLMMIFIGGVYITQLVVDHSRSEPEAYADSPQLRQYWGSLGSSILSLFQALSGGVDWDVLLAPLRAVTQWSVVMAILFAGYIAFAMFVMLNLVTGIFVDSAQTNVREDRDLDLVNRVRELFMTTDDDHSGCITWEEFQSQLHNPQMEEYFKVIDLDMSEAQNLFNLLDIRGIGYITAEEFVNGALRLRGAARAFDFMVHIHHAKRIYLRLLAGLKTVEQNVSLIAQEMHIEAPQMPTTSFRTSQKIFSKKFASATTSPG